MAPLEVFALRAPAWPRVVAAAVGLGRAFHEPGLDAALLSIVRAGYVFIGRDFKSPWRLWGAIRRELEWMQQCLCMIQVDLTLEWDCEMWPWTRVGRRRVQSMH